MTSRIRYYFDLVILLTLKELKIRYKHSVLGYFWSILNPLLLSLVFYFAFKLIAKIPIENYTFFLICGLFPWQWFSNSVSSSAGVLLGNVSLIKKLNFPRQFLPLSLVLNDTVHFLMCIPVIAGFGIYYGIMPTLAWIYGIPVLIFLQLFLTYGFSLFVSSINLFFRDLERLIGIGLTILFYLTPILYDLSFIPKKFLNFFYLNPLFPLIVSWRDLFMKGYLNVEMCLFAFPYMGIIFLFGYFVFKRLSWKFAEVL